MRHKKGDKNQQTDKIVLFPNLHERLITKGLEELSNKNFHQSVQLFIQAKEYDAENYEVNMGLLVSLIELQQYIEAREICLELLKMGIGDYFQITSIYLMVLLQLNEHHEIVTTIELLFKENQIPFDKIDHFSKMLTFSKKVVEEKKVEEELHEELLQKQFQQEGVFVGKNDQELLDAITKLSQMNIRPFVNEIQQFLQQEETHPFYKTMLLSILKEQDYTQPLELKKFSKIVSIIPSELPELNEQSYFKEVLLLLEQELSQNDPSLLEMTQSLLERHHFLLYPFEPEQELTAMAAAYHALAAEYMTGQEISHKIIKMYNTEMKKVEECLMNIKQIEGISSPII